MSDISADYDGHQLVVSWNTHNPTSGKEQDADTDPEIRVYDEDGGLLEQTTVGKTDSQTGFYTVKFDIQNATGALIVRVSSEVDGVRQNRSVVVHE